MRCRLNWLVVPMFLLVLNMAYAEERGSIQLLKMHIIDSTNSLSVKEIARRTTWIPDNGVINLGFTKYTCWVRLIINKRQAPASLWQLNVTYPILDSLTYYEKSPSGQWKEILSGELVTEKPIVAYDRNYAFDINPGFVSDTVYLKVKTEGAMYIPLKVDQHSEPSLYNQFIEKLYGGYFGALLIMIFFNLALFFVLQDRSFLLYVTFIFFQGVIHFFFTGHHVLFLPRWIHPYFNQALLVAMFGCNIFAAWFSISFLDLKRHHALLYKIILGLILASLCFIPLKLVAGYRLSALYISLLYLVTPLTLLVAGIVCWRKQQVYARYFTISWLVFLVSVILLSLRTLGILDGKYNLEVMVQIGSILDVVLLGIALGERYNSFREEKNKALKKSLEYSVMLEKQTREQNRMLEERIKERTSELEVSRDMIEEQNAMLIDYNNNLENEVSQRTNDLTVLIEELQLHARNFDHYSYIVSHNLRAPVAQILGLIGVLEKDELSEGNLNLVNHLANSVRSLDVVVKDLNTILDIKNGKGISFETVDLFELVNEFKKQNEQQINEHCVSITVDMGAISSIRTIRLYIRSICYNLLSNAIKYRHPERSPQITVFTRRDGENVLISFSDNGRGMDLEKISNKIFGLYQRFETELDIEGRGLGLYMVKAQVEFLKGQITVSSEPGYGTTFEVTLPVNVQEQG